ncbi:hypothetical protein Tco_0260156 [Tanacetum coccineum]
MNELNELRDQAYENSLIYKEKTKKNHDSKIKNRVFNVVELSQTDGPNFKDCPDFEDSRASDTMADVNVDAPAEQAPAMAPPARTDEQILPRIRWVPIGKSNCYLDMERSQSNPIYKIVVDILMQTNFFRAFVASSTIPSRILWDVINRAHIDYAERMWEEFTQFIHTFSEDKKNLAQHTQGKKKAILIVISSVRFTKLVIFHLQREHKFHPRPESPLHLPTKEPILGYLKFSAKGTKQEVFGMPISNELITDDVDYKRHIISGIKTDLEVG